MDPSRRWTCTRAASPCVSSRRAIPLYWVETILDKRRYALDHLDHLRKLLIFEPRGHYDMYGVVPVEPDLPGADFAVLFLHNEGYSTMCGHATIALGRYIIDQGLVPVTEPCTEINLQCPCGMVLVRVAVERTADGLQTGSVSFESVPSFAFATERVVDVAGLGSVTYDIGYGGAFYAVVAAPRIGFDLETTPLAVLVEASAAITEAVKAGVCLEHPDDPELGIPLWHDPDRRARPVQRGSYPQCLRLRGPGS